MAAWPWRYACNCVHDSALVKMAPWIILRSLSGLACCPPHGLHAPATHRAPMSWSLTCMCLMDAQECADAGRIVGTALPADSAAGKHTPTDRLRSLASAAVAMDHTVIGRSCTTQWSQRRNANLSGGASLRIRAACKQTVCTR